MSRIKWEMGRYAVQRGVVGKLELFSLTQSTRRDSKDWELRTDLPGIARDHRLPSEEQAKEKAGLLFGVFLRQTDAVPDLEREDQLRHLLSYCRSAADGNGGNAGDLEASGANTAYTDVATKLAAILDGEG